MQMVNCKQGDSVYEHEEADNRIFFLFSGELESFIPRRQESIERS